MSYTVKDLWNLKLEDKVYAGRSRQDIYYIKMTKLNKHRTQLNRERVELKKAELKMAKTLASQLQGK